jgi:hypothetical protein
MIISNYEAKITLNSVEIPDWSSFYVYDKLGVAETEFGVELKRPKNISEGSTITITDGLGSSKQTLVSEKNVEYTSGTITSTLIKGTGSSITRKAPSRSIFYVNKTWIDSITPYYSFRNGIIYNTTSPVRNLKRHGVSVDRLFISGLPGKNLRDSEIECVLESGITYHDILEDILGRIGYNVIISLPNLDVQKSLAVNSGTPYFSVINQLYGNWNPIVKIIDTTVYVLDYGGDNQGQSAGTGVYSLSEDSFSVYSWDKVDLENTVDHLVINGPSTNWTYKGFKSNNMAKLELGHKELSGESATYVTETKYSEDPKYLDEFAGKIKLDIAYEYSNLATAKNKRSVRTLKTKINQDTDDEVVVEETTKVYDGNDNLTKKVIIKKFYYDWKTPVGTRIEEYGRYAKLNIGQSNEYNGEYLTYIPDDFDFGLVALTEEKYGTFVGNTGLVETSKKTYRRCFSYETQVENDDGTFTVLQTPQPVHVINQIGIPTFESVDEEDADASRWREDLILYEEEEIRINALSDRLLMKSRFITKYVPIKSEFSVHEDVPLRRRQVFRDVVEKRWEFYYIDDQATMQDGDNPPSGDFHPKVEIYEPDVIEQRIAQMIADRYFASKRNDNTRATITTTTPLWGVQVGSLVKLPSCTKEYFDWSSKTYQEVTIESQYFWVTGRRRVAKFTGEVGDSQRDLDVYDELELKERF